ncbi:MAG: LysO family transporter [Acidobacteria bacterium]|nr:LysO family transporter [Acidobacteriota bacterium]
MIIILSCIAGGFFLGLFFKDNKKAGSIFIKLTDFSIYVLLLFLGISVGSNREIIDNIGQIGLQVLIITLLGLMGSLCLAYFVGKHFFKGEKR